MVSCSAKCPRVNRREQRGPPAQPGSVELQGFFTFDELAELTEEFLRFF